MSALVKKLMKIFIFRQVAKISWESGINCLQLMDLDRSGNVSLTAS